MAYVLTKDVQVVAYPYTIDQLRTDNPNTSFPIGITLDQLAEFGVFEVQQTQRPAVDWFTQNCNDSTLVFENGVWKQTWSISQATPEETLDRENIAKEDNKQEAMRLLAETDWVVMPDVPLKNKDEFIAYRTIIRSVAINPVISVEWPTKPSAQW